MKQKVERSKGECQHLYDVLDQAGARGRQNGLSGPSVMALLGIPETRRGNGQYTEVRLLTAACPHHGIAVVSTRRHKFFIPTAAEEVQLSIDCWEKNVKAVSYRLAGLNKLKAKLAA